MSRFSITLLIALLGFANSGQAGPSSDHPDWVPGGVDGCLSCHRPGSPLEVEHPYHAWQTDADGERKPVDCQSCHGPSANHLMPGPEGRPPPPINFDQRTPVAEQDAACLSCHQNETDMAHWMFSAHHDAEIGCASCHTVHQEPQPVVRGEQTNEQCLACHTELRADLQRRSHHPMASGEMDCLSCHNPHGSPTPGDLTELSLNDLCIGCHMDLRGPFLWEHPPASEDCTLCHQPHGSNHRALLQARTPWLCQDCHQAPFHPSSLESGAGLPGGSASRSLLMRDCLSCHTQVHGSNHPGGVGLTR